MENIIYENEFTRIELNEVGRIISLKDNLTSREYLAEEGCFALAVGEDIEYLPVKAINKHIDSMTEKTTKSMVERSTIEFELENKANDKMVVEMEACVYPHYFTFEIISILSEFQVSQLTLASINLNIKEKVSQMVNACYNDNFAVSVMALTYPVQGISEQNPEYTSLSARCYTKFGIENNKFAIIASPYDRFFDIIEEVEKDHNLPSPYLGGKWAKVSEDIRRSYLFVRDLSEDNVNQVIGLVKQMNASMIMMESAVWSESLGHYNINRVNFPRGMDSLKNVVDEMHRAGIRAGLHFLPVLINDSDSYITPIPDKRLNKAGEASLVNDINEDATTLECMESIVTNSVFPEKVEDPYREAGTDILIEDEIIHYGTKKIVENIGGKEKVIFESCIRGAYGTKASSHSEAAKIQLLRRVYGEFQSDMDTTIMDEISARIAEIVNYCGFDMVYFDGSEALQLGIDKDSRNNHWYYNAKLHYDFYNKLKRKDILYQASSTSHFSWHMMCRTAIADGFRDIKRSLDKNIVRIESAKSNFLPVDIGWYALGASNISYDDIEYILCRSIGFNSSVGFQVTHMGQTIKIDDLLRNPEVPALIDLINKYEKLRQSNYFDEETKAMLRKPGTDYKLVQDEDGNWIFVEKSVVN